MESFCLMHSILPYFHAISIPFNSSPATRFYVPQPRHLRLLVSSKRSDFEDFQGYAKPLSLVPATQVKIRSNSMLDEMMKSVGEVKSQSLYRILLRTSSIYGSDLTDMSAGILICIISETGDSILQRIPAIDEFIFKGPNLGNIEAFDHDVLCFKRSSIDEFIFKGPNLGNIEAVWISVESGRWRLGGANLTVINGLKLQSGESTDNNEYTSVRYDFEVEDILLGEGGDITMIELRPCAVTEYSDTDISELLNTDVTRSTYPGEKLITNEESMQEYANLKFSLLLYDAILISAGTSVATFTVGENSALAFLAGGIGGFLYLLLLQRSVDGLQGPDTSPPRKEENISRVFGGLKGPLLIITFSFGIAILVAKHGSTEVDTVFSSKEIVVGMMGFLACKLAVVLAAFKPLSVGLEDAD